MIYYVEDDTNIRDLALYALRQSNIEAQGFDGGMAFKEACIRQVPDLILLDVMLPGEDGIMLLRWVRNTPSLACVPVMILSAKGTEFDKVCGLDAGADDYLAKPYGMMELVSRCKALMRRHKRTDHVNQQDVLQVSSLKLFCKDHRVCVDDIEVVLTLKEFDLLKKLMKNPGQAFTRAQLLEDIWNVRYAGETRTVDTHIQTLRHKLNITNTRAGDLIQTVRGVGYRLSKEA